jgi:hypothetical protein
MGLLLPSRSPTNLLTTHVVAEDRRFTTWNAPPYTGRCPLVTLSAARFRGAIVFGERYMGRDTWAACSVF